MVKWATSEDLLKMKVDIWLEQQQARHQQNNIIQNTIRELDEVKTQNTLLNQSVWNMQEWIKEIKTIVKEWFKEVWEKFESMPNKFITKEEYTQHKNRISVIEKVLWSIWFLVISWFIWWILKLILK